MFNCLLYVFWVCGLRVSFMYWLVIWILRVRDVYLLAWCFVEYLLRLICWYVSSGCADCFVLLFGLCLLIGTMLTRCACYYVVCI